MATTFEPREAVRAVRPGEGEAAALVLVDAFDRDPFGQWLYPDPGKRRAAHVEFFRSVVLEPSPGALIDVTADLDAVAIWYPPGTSLSGGAPSDVSPAARELLEGIDRTEPPGPFWYLAFLGARTSGRGGGSTLLRHRLATLEGRTALWTANPRNLGFYGRFGYGEVASVVVEGAQAWWLARDAQP